MLWTGWCRTAVRFSRIFHGELKPGWPIGIVMSFSWFTEPTWDLSHEFHRSGPDGMRGIIARHLRRDAFGALLERLARAMRHGSATLYRAMGGRASEVDGRQMALRISASQRQGRDG